MRWSKSSSKMKRRGRQQWGNSKCWMNKQNRISSNRRLRIIKLLSHKINSLTLIQILIWIIKRVSTWITIHIKINQIPINSNNSFNNQINHILMIMRIQTKTIIWCKGQVSHNSNIMTQMLLIKCKRINILVPTHHIKIWINPTNMGKTKDMERHLLTILSITTKEINSLLHLLNTTNNHLINSNSTSDHKVKVKMCMVGHHRWWVRVLDIFRCRQHLMQILMANHLLRVIIQMVDKEEDILDLMGNDSRCRNLEEG